MWCAWKLCVCDMLLAFYNRSLNITNRKVPFLSTLLRPPSTESQVRILGMRLGTIFYTNKLSAIACLMYRPAPPIPPLQNHHLYK